MAYHVVCNNEAETNPRFRKIDSKYTGDCAAQDCKLGGKIEIGQPVWYWVKEQPSSGSAQSSSEVEALRKELAEVRFQIRKMQESVNLWIVFNGLFKPIWDKTDWHSLPKRDRSNDRGGAQEAIELFDGKETFAS